MRSAITTGLGTTILAAFLTALRHVPNELIALGVVVLGNDSDRIRHFLGLVDWNGIALAERQPIVIQNRFGALFERFENSQMLRVDDSLLAVICRHFVRR